MIGFAFFSAFLSLGLSSWASLMFSVPAYGVKPSFPVICFFTHRSSMNFDPSRFPEKTVPLSGIVFKELAPLFHAIELLKRRE